MTPAMRSGIPHGVVAGYTFCEQAFYGVKTCLGRAVHVIDDLSVFSPVIVHRHSLQLENISTISSRFQWTSLPCSIFLQRMALIPASCRSYHGDF